MKRLLLVFALPVLLSAGIAVTFYSTTGADQDKAAEQTKTVYVCPMHPDVISDKPGKCPKCGMSLVARETKSDAKTAVQKPAGSPADDKINQARSLIDHAKKELAQGGKYDCCLKHPCDECLLAHKSCDCAVDVKAGKGVCSQCYGGWQRGDGGVEGVDAKKVKGNFQGHGPDH